MIKKHVLYWGRYFWELFYFSEGLSLSSFSLMSKEINMIMFPLLKEPIPISHFPSDSHFGSGVFWLVHLDSAEELLKIYNKQA